MFASLVLQIPIKLFLNITRRGVKTIKDVLLIFAVLGFPQKTKAQYVQQAHARLMNAVTRIRCVAWRYVSVRVSQSRNFCKIKFALQIRAILTSAVSPKLQQLQHPRPHKSLQRAPPQYIQQLLPFVQVKMTWGTVGAIIWMQGST